MVAHLQLSTGNYARGTTPQELIEAFLGRALEASSSRPPTSSTTPEPEPVNTAVADVAWMVATIGPHAKRAKKVTDGR